MEKPMKIDDAIKDLLRARKRLESDQGSTARRNARAAITVAVMARHQVPIHEITIVADRVAAGDLDLYDAILGASGGGSEMTRAMVSAQVSGDL